MRLCVTRIFFGAVLLVLTGCATSEGRRTSNAPIVRTTTKSLATFQSCFATRQEGRLIAPPTYTPKENGGTFTNNTSSSGLSLYVVDIIDTGNQREVRLYAKGGLYGSQKQVLAAIDQCL